MTETHRELRTVVEKASATASQIFLHTGYYSPMWHCLKRDGEELVFEQPHRDKDMATAMMRAAFEIFDIVAYVFIDEAWVLEAKLGASATAAEREAFRNACAAGIKHHPDRIECLMFAAEDLNGMLMARRTIIRDKGKLKLAELVFWDGGELSGRLVGLLPRRGPVQ